MTKTYSNTLTASINRKGVLDVDVVKGCAHGIEAHGEKGCYHACYAARSARFYGFDFSVSVVRTVHSRNQAKYIERAVRRAPFGFFRVGTMGDPSYAWEETVGTVEWLAPYAVPVIVTKHWLVASDVQLQRLVRSGAIINTSVSALDSDAHLVHRMGEIERYRGTGGASVARIVSCDFNTNHPVGWAKNKTQAELFGLDPTIDNPLRVGADHPLVAGGLIRVRRVHDIGSKQYVSMPPQSATYIGHCRDCPDRCGVFLLDGPDVRPPSPQYELFPGWRLAHA